MGLYLITDLFFFFFFFFFLFLMMILHQLVLVSSSSSSSSLSPSLSPAAHNNSRMCSSDQSIALLQFKQRFTINSRASSECGDRYGIYNDVGGVVSYPKTSSWSESNDCCTWDGITCYEFTADVIGLDLSCSQLLGAIDSNSTLFQLSHLHTLNLAFNDFSLSTTGGSISHAFGGFMYLTHLNLSHSKFSGNIPSEISHLSKLVSLDLSYQQEVISLEPQTFKMLLQNLTQLRHLFLDYVNISSVLPRNISSSLASISLPGTELYGKLPDNIFDLPNLQTLLLFVNSHISGYFPKVNRSISSSLMKLDLSSTGLFGELPDSIINLKSSSILDLSSCNFSGYIPKSLGNLTQLTYLSLQQNNFNGELPSTLSNLDKLTHLYLSDNTLDGQIPFFLLANLGKLRFLDSHSNNLNGQFPSLVSHNQTQLVYLDLSNNSLTGPIPPNSSELPNLLYLSLSDNYLNGTIPSWLFTLPSLIWLDVKSNRLSGQISEFQYNVLVWINLSDNQLSGTIPKSVAKLVNLTDLDISSNNLSGVMELEMFLNLKELDTLDLSYNTNITFRTTSNNVNTTFPKFTRLLLSSCKLREFPDFLRYAENFQFLDLSNNKIEGQIPSWAWSMWRDSLVYLNLSQNSLTSLQQQIPWQNLYLLDLRSNLLEGPLPVPPSLGMRYFFMSNNKLSREISSTICKLSSLEFIDLSYNNLSGVIPQCLANFSNALTVLDLRMNRFSGTIPDTFSEGNKLRSLNLNGNQLEGPMPLSLSTCRHLEVLNLGNNNMTDAFPHRLANLPELQVLVLKSNRFHGPIFTTSITTFLFPKLRILDLSHNEFVGHLPEKYFKDFKAMMNVDESKMKLEYIGDGNLYQDTVMLMVKGSYIQLERILTFCTTIDLSSNKFQGEVPKFIGKLDSLRLLNLSHNNLTGHVPPSLGDMTKLESLDLSWNQLEGTIPGELTNLTALAGLNLSQNRLVGQIPQGNQFNTFPNDSYGGNLALCGFPLSESCMEDKPPQIFNASEDESDFFSGFTWESVVMGYGFGMVVGLVAGCTMFLIGKPRRFVGIVERERLRRGKRSRKSIGPIRSRRRM